ncbi:hypothetical protein PsorP6_002850 [Peronosclerospora sorghi]|uniref:Uncharacterized protein n=1 Tax=Peronosclerospora sorghi TaxID=230839 RepID=A0ACC0VJD9_9STRA|nr:hypothetical protein PsorP6_002850 [Peronosclerospora sorghi]
MLLKKFADDDERMNPLHQFQEHTQPESVEADLTRIKGASSSTAEATGDLELRIRAAKDLIAGAHYPSMVETFRNTIDRKGYEKHIFSSLCKIFGDEVMPKVLFHLKEEGRLSPSMVLTRWDSQFKYWKGKHVS